MEYKIRLTELTPADARDMLARRRAEDRAALDAARQTVTLALWEDPETQETYSKEWDVRNDDASRVAQALGLDWEQEASFAQIVTDEVAAVLAREYDPELGPLTDLLTATID